MKNSKVKKPNKRTAAEKEIIDQAAQQLAEILVEVIYEKHATEPSSTQMNQTPKTNA